MTEKTTPELSPSERLELAGARLTVFFFKEVGSCSDVRDPNSLDKSKLKALMGQFIKTAALSLDTSQLSHHSTRTGADHSASTPRQVTEHLLRMQEAENNGGLLYNVELGKMLDYLENNQENIVPFTARKELAGILFEVADILDGVGVVTTEFARLKQAAASPSGSGPEV